jgi:hypothetical protein
MQFSPIAQPNSQLMYKKWDDGIERISRAGALLITPPAGVWQY